MRNLKVREFIEGCIRKCVDRLLADLIIDIPKTPLDFSETRQSGEVFVPKLEQ
ncbi:hypothetical protein CDL12_29622 [Handroanthus impetiginosus]|uniref:Uncharacterized protein n=1 Tax=Handroanthus impetiginosus TaxID=429701 RepID=A0A2G9FXX1_9LAMI|nr:hypothetical protein CDL12_29622 [Handroanthus impetiginosus]